MSDLSNVTDARIVALETAVTPVTDSGITPLLTGTPQVSYGGNMHSNDIWLQLTIGGQAYCFPAWTPGHVNDTNV